MLESLGPVWERASLDEKNRLLHTMLEAVYLDLVATKSVVGIVPKPAFYPLFESLLADADGKTRVFKPNPEDLDDTEGEQNADFSQRSVELHLKHGLAISTVVVLPVPLGQRRANTSPLNTRRSIPRTASICR